MKGKALSILIALLLVASALGILTACAGSEDMMTVVFQDGDQVLYTQEVEKGGKAQRPEDDPQKDGYIFINWYGTPTFSVIYDFDRIIEEDVTIFAGFAQHETDTREYYLLGNGKSPLLYASNWGNTVTDDYKMQKSTSETENIYTMTVDLAEGDEFVFAVPGWGYKHGAGYIVNPVIDGVACFKEGDKLDNVKVLESGNYTFTMKTYPKHMSAGGLTPDDANYIYEVKGQFDTIEVVRNGDMVEGPVQSVTDFYIKGSGITDWKDFYSPATKMTGVSGVYTLEVYLKENEAFMFGSTNTLDGVVSVGNDTILYDNLTDESRIYFTQDGNNIKTKAAGLYSFSYTQETKQLSVEFDDAYVPAEADYYLNGNFGGGNWDYSFGTEYKFIETSEGSGIFELKGVVLDKDSEMTVQAYKKGSTEMGDYGTDTWNMLGDYNFPYLYGATDAFSAVSADNKNIKVLQDGTYDFTFNSYSKMLTIKSATAVYDIYINGTLNGWAHNWSEEYKFSAVQGETGKYELVYTFAAGDEFGFVKFNEGETTGYGDYIGAAKVGTAQDNALFVPAQGSNFVASRAGTFRIIYDSSAGTVDFYEVV